MNILEKIEQSGIPTDRASQAIQHMRDHGLFELDAQDYRERIALLTNVDAPTSDERELNYLYRYIITDAIQNSEVDASQLVSGALTKARKFISTHQYVFAKPEEEKAPKLDAAGNVKPKKGAKKELAKKVYNEQIKDNDLSRKEAIAILVEEVGLTPAGASTYYANLKKGKL